jgi:hypothetical protein
MRRWANSDFERDFQLLVTLVDHGFVDGPVKIGTAFYFCADCLIKRLRNRGNCGFFIICQNWMVVILDVIFNSLLAGSGDYA